jgi:hypothetical protein
LGLLLDFEGWDIGFSLWMMVCSGGYVYIAMSRRSGAHASSLRSNITLIYTAFFPQRPSPSDPL